MLFEGNVSKIKVKVVKREGETGFNMHVDGDSTV